MRPLILAVGLGLACLWHPAMAVPAVQAAVALEAPSSLLTEVRSSSGRPRTQSVRGYTRRDGRHVSSYRRAPPRR